MSLYTYRVFHTIVQCKSFARAAGQLHLTPSAISHAVSDMEEEFGFPLFIREKKNVTLTENGAQIYSYIQDILYTSDLLEKRISQINGSQRGSVRLGLIDSTAIQWLEGIMNAFRAKSPNIEVIVRGKHISLTCRGCHKPRSGSGNCISFFHTLAYRAPSVYPFI